MTFFKKKISIAMFFFLFSLFFIQAENVDIRIRTSTGEVIVEKVPKDIRKWVHAYSDQSKYLLASVENLGDLPELKSIEFYNISSVRDYSFLLKAKGLVQLHLAGCTVNDLSFLEEMTNLEYLYVDIYIPANKKLQVRAKSVDLKKLTRLDYLVFHSPDYGCVPNFVNILSRPYVELANNSIKKFTKQDIYLLKQYSVINLMFNPVADNVEERQKVNSMKVIFDVQDPLPENIANYQFVTNQ